MIAVAFGRAGIELRQLVPLPFFGILLLFAGIQHARLAFRAPDVADLPFVVLAGVLAVLFSGNLAYAGGLTLAAYWAVRGSIQLLPRARTA